MTDETTDHQKAARAALEKARALLGDASLDDEDLRSSLVDVMEQLERELDALSDERGHSGRLRAVREVSEIVTEKISEKPVDPDFVKPRLENASDAIVGWEASHPRIASLLGDFVDQLQRLGL